MPHAILLKALTAEMDVSFRGKTLEIVELPFRMGRESRGAGEALPSGLPDRRTGSSNRNNDFYISEKGSRLFVSRQHLMLEERDGQSYCVDLFSSCGTIVEGRYLGGNHIGGEAPVNDGDVIILGTSGSPYMFKVLFT